MVPWYPAAVAPRKCASAFHVQTRSAGYLMKQGLRKAGSGRHSSMSWLCRTALDAGSDLGRFPSQWSLQRKQHTARSTGPVRLPRRASPCQAAGAGPAAGPLRRNAPRQALLVLSSLDVPRTTYRLTCREERTYLMCTHFGLRML